MNYFTDMLFTKLRNNSLNIRVFRQCFDMLKDRCHKSLSNLRHTLLRIVDLNVLKVAERRAGN